MRDDINNRYSKARKLTSERAHYLEMAQKRTTPPLTRGQLAILCQELPSIGMVNSTEAFVLLKIINAVPAESFRPGSEPPIVFKSNRALAMEAGRSERSISRILSSLIDCGLITMKDSGNYKRHAGKGEADGCGINLKILMIRHDELMSAIRAAKAEHTARQALKRQLSGARRNFRAALQSAPAHIARRLESRYEKINALVAHAAGAETSIIKRAIMLIEWLTRTIFGKNMAHMTCTPANFDKHIHITTPHQIDSNDKRREPNGSPELVQSGYARRAYEKSLIETPRQGKPKQGQSTNLPGLSDLIAAIRPSLETFGLRAPSSWADLAQLMPKMCVVAGISIDARDQAIHRMGAQAAATAVAVTFQKTCSGQVKSPGGYLRAITDRSASGNINLPASVFGLVQQHAR
ncbi:replication initiation protein RepC [Allorhizobium sp. BGMRC 0089]|uniref:replication initiation protein RepC n=1 Tax=Allorhizobium sonneratiae TaxID=2934936 RepID=UPI00237D1B2F|nr:replication initiation protein RepC [Allorhizobium sonneratiae]MCM2294693.1 replication initiation protein RepC [Allorhizobium sonneratiae]